MVLRQGKSNITLIRETTLILNCIPCSITFQWHVTTTNVCQLARLSPHHIYSGWVGTIVALVPASPIIFTQKFVRHGKVWCGADQAKKQAPHLKTGSPMSESALDSYSMLCTILAPWSYNCTMTQLDLTLGFLAPMVVPQLAWVTKSEVRQTLLL